ncbi:MAG: archaeosine biosynthesis radical SAM protein RaSEA [Thermoplasmatota archaeon]
MNELAQFCKSQKKDFTPKIQDTTRPVRYWSEKDILQGAIVDAYVIILRTQGCFWARNSGCSMCGYFNDSLWDTVTDQDLIKQFNTAMKQYKNEQFVKIFTSGSFLDDNEIGSAVQNHILSTLYQSAKKISVESRPEFITDKKLLSLQHLFLSKVFEVGIGLETANDVIRKYAINKGFSFKDYIQAAKVLKKNSIHCKTYLLAKPPFLTEREAIDDCIHTIKKIDKYADIISINPTNVQRNTAVDYLWKRSQFRPIWLWSIVEILKKSKTLTNAQIKCDIAGGGSRRGAHNCESCDGKILDAIAQFSLLQDPCVFNGLDCSCKNEWLDQLDIESLSFGSAIDLS